MVIARVVSAIAWRTSETVSSVIVGPLGWMVVVSKGMGMLLCSRMGNGVRSPQRREEREGTQSSEAIRGRAPFDNKSMP